MAENTREPADSGRRPYRTWSLTTAVTAAVALVGALVVAAAPSPNPRSARRSRTGWRRRRPGPSTDRGTLVNRRQHDGPEVVEDGGGLTAVDPRILDAIRRDPAEFERMLPPDLLDARPPSATRPRPPMGDAPVPTRRRSREFDAPTRLPGGAAARRGARRGMFGPATRAGFYMAVLAVGCALSAANPRLAAAKGGVGITLLHVVGTGAFAAMLLVNPWFIRSRHLGAAAFVLGTSTGLEALLAQYPWEQVQHIVRTGCAVVALSMASILIFSFRPTKRMRAFFFSGLVVGAVGSLVVAVGVFLAAKWSHPADTSAAVANLIVAVGAWGLGLKCLGLRVLPALDLSRRTLEKVSEPEPPMRRESDPRPASRLPARTPFAERVQRYFRTAGELVGVRDDEG